MSIRMSKVNAMAAYSKSMDGLQDGVERPSVPIGATKNNSRHLATSYEQPCNIRRAGFTDSINNPNMKKDVAAMNKLFLLQGDTRERQIQ